MHVAYGLVVALFITAGTACIITSNVLFYRICAEVNSKRPQAQQFSFLFVNIRFFEITGEHARLFPQSRKRSLMYLWAGSGFALFLCLIGTALLTAQEATVAHRQQYTGYPPSVYMQLFFPCSADAPCTRTDDFQVDPVPNDCCILTVTNGDGRGTDEARSYEVFLNGKRVVPVDHSRNAQAPVTVLRSNTLKVILTGEPSSKLFVLIAYDPRKSK